MGGVPDMSVFDWPQTEYNHMSKNSKMLKKNVYNVAEI